MSLNSRWRRFTAPRHDLLLLGTVQCGLEIGALARTRQGRYLQINGSIVRELNQSRIKAAIERARRDLSHRLAQDAERLSRGAQAGANSGPALLAARLRDPAVLVQA